MPMIIAAVIGAVVAIATTTAQMVKSEQDASDAARQTDLQNMNTTPTTPGRTQVPSTETSSTSSSHVPNISSDQFFASLQENRATENIAERRGLQASATGYTIPSPAREAA